MAGEEAQEPVVTPEEREKELEAAQGYQDEVAKGAEAKEKKRQEEELEKKKAELLQLDALERLMRQEATDSFNLVFKDVAGDYAIPIRYLSTSERREVIKMVADLGLAGAEASADEENALESVDKAFDKFVEMAASMVTDPVIAQGIRDGKLSDKTCLDIVKAGLKRTVALEETGASFRLN